MIENLKFLKRYVVYYFENFKQNIINKKKLSKYREDKITIIKFLKNEINFAFSRFSDGELYMLKNKPLSISEDLCIVDNKVFGKANYTKEEIKEFIPEKHNFYHQQLVKAISHEQHNYFKGISCSCCNGEENVKFMKDFIKNKDFISFSNLFFNANYESFLNFFIKFLKKKKVIFVMSKYADTKKLPFNCKKIFYVGENCMINNYSLIEKMLKYVKNSKINNHIFLFSAGTLSNFLIYNLYKNYPNNTYIDIGSFFNPLLDMNGWKVSRGYLQEYWLNKKPKYHLNKICYWN